MSDLLAQAWKAIGAALPALAAVVGVVLTGLAGVVALRKKASAKEKAKPPPAPSAPAPPSLASVWGTFVRALGEAGQRAPVTIVLGERRAGKTSLIEASRRDLAGSAADASDPRMGLSYGGDRIVLEIASSLLEDARPESDAELRGLLDAIAWRTELIVVALDPRSPSWSAPGLKQTGRLARDVADELSRSRGRAVRLRACVTHGDEALASFVDLVHALSGDEGRGAPLDLPLRPASYAAANLAGALCALDPYLSSTIESASFPAFVRLAHERGPAGRLLRSLAPFFAPLVEPPSRVAPPRLDGVYLTACPEGSPPALLADPFALDASIEADMVETARRVDRGRAARAIAAVAVCAAILGVVYAWHYARAARARTAVAAYVARAAAADVAPAAVADDEAAAGAALVPLLDPTWPPLRAAYPRAKDAAVKGFFDATRGYYLLPAARKTDAETRVYALALLYATRADPLGWDVPANADAWGRRIGVPERLPADVVALAATAWTQVPNLPALPEAGLGSTLDGWYAYLRALRVAFASPKLTPASLAPLARDASSLSSYVRDAATTETLASLTERLRRRGLPVDAWLDHAIAVGAAPEWVNGYREPLNGLLTMVRRTSLSGPPDPARKTLAEAIADLKSMAATASTRSSEPRVTMVLAASLPASAASSAAPASSASLPASPDAGSVPDSGAPREPPPPPVYEVSLDGEAFAFDSARWSSLVLASRAALYLAGFERDVASPPRSPFFTPDTCRGDVGAALIPGRGPTGSIPCVTTAAVFADEVGPPLAAVDDTMKLVALPDEDRARFARFVTAAATSYGGEYRAALDRYYASYRLEGTTAEGLGADVSDMASPGSFFTEFLATTAKNADLGPSRSTYEGRVADSLADLAPIVVVMTDDKGKYPNLEKYLAVLAPLTTALKQPRPTSPVAPGAPLEARLSPLGALGLALAQGGDASPYVAVQKWLDAQAIPPDLRAPFMAPVNAAFPFALAELGRTVREAYESEIAPTVRPIFTRFPFDRSAELDASAEDVQAVFGPKGTFGKSFQKLVAPVCVQTSGGRYLARTTPFGPVPVPADALLAARRAALLAEALWDEGGKPIPIAMMVKPLTLGPVGNARTVTLSSITSGKSSVFGFNQTPNMQPFGVAWGGEASSVAVRTSRTGGGEDRFHTFDEGPSDWSFHRLLARATIARSVMTWSFPAEGPDTAPLRVSYEFGSDPWAAFTIPAEPP